MANALRTYASDWELGLLNQGIYQKGLHGSQRHGRMSGRAGSAMPVGVGIIYRFARAFHNSQEGCLKPDHNWAFSFPARAHC